MVVSGQNNVPAALSLVKKNGFNRIGGRLGPRSCRSGFKKKIFSEYVLLHQYEYTNQAS